MPKDQLTRYATIAGLIVAFLSIIAATRAYGDDRYVKRADYEQDIGDMKADLRVLRCRVAGDCH